VSRFALRLRGVSKRYGKTRALDGLDLDVPKGALLGLVGPNGAGKTTAFGVVAGTIRADGGTIDVLGEGPFDPARTAGRLTMLPQDCELNPHSSARQLLTFYARLQGMSAKRAAMDASRVLDVVRLSDRAQSRVGQLSHGMRRRLAVAQALLGEPELVLLDEPTGGLDPHLVVQMREVLLAERGKRTLIVSSHILADLEATCDHVAFMEAGRCVKSGAVHEVMQRGALLRVRSADPIDDEIVRGLLSGHDARIEGDALAIRLKPDADPAAAVAQIVPALIAGGVRVVDVRLGESLEAAYMASRVKS
jgi:ABC-2 type transport system ATP-binding protein